MKIGILTFHCAHNFGAVLQCYALYNILNSMGHNTYIINYRPQYLISPYKPLSLYWFTPPIYFKQIIKKLLHIHDSIKRAQKFDSFINKFKTDNLDLNSPVNDYDAFIFGSDQIWSSKICKGLDHTYFANRPAFKNKLNIAYAASIGNCTLTDSELYEIKKLVQTNFKYISVREESLQQVLKSLNIQSRVVLDPTLLLNKKSFDVIAQKPKEEKYILIYQVYHDKRVREIAQEISKKRQLPIIEISSNAFEEGNKKVSPEDFIGYFKYAQYIVTTSFHGTIFSIIYNKSFYTLSINPVLDARSYSILKTIGLLNRLIKSPNEIIDDKEIDYSTVNQKLLYEQNLSLNFLQESLNNSL